MRLGIRLLIIVMFTLLLSSPKLINKGSAQGGGNHQGRNMRFGVSGGNVNDATRRFCCSGTLGALLTDGTTSYILSNNHVLGLSGGANAGEDISQPGLIDNNCQIPTIVADFTLAPQLGPSNVDAAIAQLRPGTMDASGFIEGIGVPSSIVRVPSVGLSVAKSGRTTGFTTGTIGSINTNVSVQYQRGCGQGKKFVVSYTNQVVINSSTFSAGGDSGSLIVTNDSNHQPVALLYAGSSTTTIGNPIGRCARSDQHRARERSKRRRHHSRTVDRDAGGKWPAAPGRGARHLGEEAARTKADVTGRRDWHGRWA